MTTTWIEKVELNYKFDPSPDVAAAERSWLQAIADNRGHEIVNGRWNAVLAAKDRAQRLRKRSGR